MAATSPAALPVLEVHTPQSSFAVVHSLQGDTLQNLFAKLRRKAGEESIGYVVGAGWVKYEWNAAFWDLDDDADYSIFAWRNAPSAPDSPSPIIFLRNPTKPLPQPPAYQNTSYYAFRPKSAPQPPPEIPSSEFATPSVRRRKSQGSIRSFKSGRSGRSRWSQPPENDGIPQHKRDFINFHSENGSRVVVGTFGPVTRVEMLMKKGYRHVYMSRNFARKFNLVPPDLMPGLHGYGGLVNMGTFPITVGTKTTTHTVYLAEEKQFDVVLGRAFMERRQVKTDPTDQSNVMCMDNGDVLETKIIVIRDGRGDFVTVT